MKALFQSVEATGVVYHSARDEELKLLDKISDMASGVNDTGRREQTVRIYHCLGDVDLDVIRRDGLKSRERLAKEGTLSLPPNNTFGNQPQYIYFRDIPDGELEQFHKNNNLAAIYINPDTTYVFNREFRVKQNGPHAWEEEESDLARLDAYVNSGITLRRHLHNQAIAAQKKEQLLPGQFIIRDPYDGVPFMVSGEDERVKDHRYFYLPDILIKTDCIPPDKLELYAKTISRKRAFRQIGEVRPNMEIQPHVGSLPQGDATASEPSRDNTPRPEKAKTWSEKLLNQKMLLTRRGRRGKIQGISSDMHLF